MAEKIIQCCYSNVLSETGVAGWRVVATSPDVSLAMSEAYAQIQDANVCSNEPLDENGNSLNMYELVTDKNYVYVTRITYGLMVPGGRRNNMLAHTYLFPVADGVLKDPNTFLTLTDDNFTGDIEVANQIRTSFDRSEPYTIESAKQLSGLDQERYLQLIYCLFACKEQRRTLFIHTTRTDEVIRPVLYLVLSSIPYSMRKTFSCAGAMVNDNSVKTMIFSNHHLSDELYFDLESGDNNVLDSRAVKKYARWGYVDYFANNQPDVDGVQYFDELEQMAIKLGDEKAAKSKILQIAHQLIAKTDAEELDFDGLRKKLYELLLAPVSGSAFLDDYMADYLEQINATGNRLDDEVEERLIQKLGQDVSERLEETGEQYMINRITHLPVEEGASILASLSERKFRQFVEELLKCENGEGVVDYYFAKKYVLESESWTALDQFLERVNEFTLCDIPLTTKRWTQTCMSVYKQNLMAGGDARTEVEQLKKYVSYFADDETANALCQKALDIYWDTFSVADYDESKLDEYRALATQSNPYSRCCMDIKPMMDAANSGKSSDFNVSKNLFMNHYEDLLTKKDRVRLYKLLVEALSHFALSNSVKYLKYVGALDFMRNIDANTILLNLADCMKAEDLDQFEEKYNEAVSRLGREDDKLQRTFNRALFLRMERVGISERTAVDVLLIVGQCMYENPFTIFDEFQELGVPKAFAQIVEKNPEVVFDNSKLLHQSDIIEQAEAYLEYESDYGQSIWDWVDLYRRNQRAIKKANRESDFKSSVGKLTKGLFGKRNRDEDED